MTPLIWLVSGITLIILEVATPGFIIIFFGFSACTVALVAKLVAISQAWQWMLFSILSILYIVTLRRFFTKILIGNKEVYDQDPGDEFTGKQATVIDAIRKKVGGRVEIFGASWKAVAATDIPKGATVRVVKKENLTLTVEPI